MKHEHEMDPSLRSAQRDVEASRIEVADAFEELERRIRYETSRVQNVIFKAKAPYRLMQRYPYGTLAVFAVAGLLIGSRIAGSRYAKGALPSAELDTVPDSELQGAVTGG